MFKNLIDSIKTRRELKAFVSENTENTKWKQQAKEVRSLLEECYARDLSVVTTKKEGA